MSPVKGSLVEVRTAFGTWSQGFIVHELIPGGCRVRRLSDGSVLPKKFSEQDVREAREASKRRHPSWPSVVNG